MPKGTREGMNFNRKVPNPNTAFPRSLKYSSSYEARRVEAAGSKSICCVGADARRASAEPTEAQQSPAVASRTCQHDQCPKGFDWRSRAKNFTPTKSKTSEFRDASLGAQTTAMRRSESTMRTSGGESIATPPLRRTAASGRHPRQQRSAPLPTRGGWSREDGGDCAATPRCGGGGGGGSDSDGGDGGVEDGTICS